MSKLKLIDIQLVLKLKLLKQCNGRRQLLIFDELPKSSLPPSLELAGVFLRPIRRDAHFTSLFELFIGIHTTAANNCLQPVSSK